MGLTDNWHLPWVLLTTDEVPDCPLSSTKPFFKALNIIELYCSTLFFFSGVRQCDQMCVFMGNLSSKTLKSHISSMTYDLKFLPLWERASIRCLLMRVLQKQLQVFTKVIQIRPFLIFLTIIPANFFWVKCVRFSPCHDRDFRKRPCEFRRFPTTFRRLPNFAENVRRCSEGVWALPKLLKRRQF